MKCSSIKGRLRAAWTENVKQVSRKMEAKKKNKKKNLESGRQLKFIRHEEKKGL